MFKYIRKIVGWKRLLKTTKYVMVAGMVVLGPGPVIGLIGYEGLIGAVALSSFI